MIDLLGFQISIVDLILCQLMICTFGMYHFNGIKWRWMLPIVFWTILGFYLGVYSIKAHYAYVYPNGNAVYHDKAYRMEEIK